MWVVADTTWVQPEGKPQHHCHRLVGVFTPGEALPGAGTPLRFELPDGRVLLARMRSATVWRDQAALCVDGTLTQAAGAGTRVRVDDAAPPGPAPTASP